MHLSGAKNKILDIVIKLLRKLKFICGEMLKVYEWLKCHIHSFYSGTIKISCVFFTIIWNTQLPPKMKKYLIMIETKFNLSLISNFDLKIYKSYDIVYYIIYLFIEPYPTIYLFICALCF